MDKGNVVKVGIAVVALLIAGLLIAWNFGAFDFMNKPPPPPPLSVQEEEDYQKQKKEIQRKIETGELPPPSGA